jgi:hypothetical protein
MKTENTKDAKVIDFSTFRRKKSEEQDLTRGRNKPLYVSHNESKITSMSPSDSSVKTEDFGDRVSRIKASLERINSLMAELKKMSTQDQLNDPAKSRT